MYLRVATKLFPLLVILGGCAVSQPVDVNGPRENVPGRLLKASDSTAGIRDAYDVQCGGLAKYTRSTAALRDAGVPKEDVTLLLGLTVFPSRPVIDEVYRRVDLSPAEGEAESYRTCLAVGYEAVDRALRVENERLEFDQLTRMRQAMEVSTDKKTKPKVTRTLRNPPKRVKK